MTTTKQRGSIVYDEHFGHVCTCTQGHVRDREGEALWATYKQTVQVDNSVSPTESGSWFYVCSRCGAGGWSGC